MICQIAIKAINKGDYAAMNAILDRLIGKPKASVKVVGDPNTPLTIKVIVEDYTENE